MIELFEQDTCKDLLMRGFSRAYILQMTGFDVGYNGAKLKSELRGIDRFQYKIEHIKTRISVECIKNAIASYGEGSNKTDVLFSLGLSGENVVKLRDLFDNLGFIDLFKEADKANRKLNMIRGTVNKFGVDNVFKLPRFQEIAALTRTEKYGAPYTLCHESVLSDVARGTLNTRMSDDVFKQGVIKKRICTNLQRYGVEHVAQNDDILQRMIETRKKTCGTLNIRYPIERMRKALDVEPGSVWFNGSFITRSEWASLTYADRSVKARQTCLQRYGVEWPSQTELRRQQFGDFVRLHMFDFLKKRQQTSLDRYGVPWFAQTVEARLHKSLIMSDAEYQRQLVLARVEKGLWGISEPEERLYNMLVKRFGIGDVRRQYRDERYDFFCDFYIVSRDMFIELNGTWTHGGHWFNPDNGSDMDKYNLWMDKDNKYYDNAIVTWTVRDVQKRFAASCSNLNYIVFWDVSLSDALCWFEHGCEDRKDWKGV